MTTLFAILKAIATLGPLFVAFVQWYKDLPIESQKKFVADGATIFRGLKQAQKPEGYYEASKNIQDLIHRL